MKNLTIFKRELNYFENLLELNKNVEPITVLKSFYLTMSRSTIESKRIKYIEAMKVLCEKNLISNEQLNELIQTITNAKPVNNCSIDYDGYFKSFKDSKRVSQGRAFAYIIAPFLVTSELYEIYTINVDSIKFQKTNKGSILHFTTNSKIERDYTVYLKENIKLYEKLLNEYIFANFSSGNKTELLFVTAGTDITRNQKNTRKKVYDSLIGYCSKDFEEYLKLNNKTIISFIRDDIKSDQSKFFFEQI